MNQKQLLDYCRAECDKMLAIMEAKNSDYAGGKDEYAFNNFEKVKLLGICDTEIGFLTRMTDKMCRITSFVKNKELMVKDESVKDTLRDLANYALLMAAYIEDTYQEATP